MESSSLLSTLALLALWIAASWAWGRAFLPLSRHLFPNLLDGGLAAGRLLALVLVALLAFEGAILHIISLQFSPLLVLAAPLALQYQLRRDPAQLEEFREWARSKRRDLLVADAIFMLGWIAFAWIRLQNPALSDLEKPMDAGLLSSATRAVWLPFENFWMAGVPFTNYYYFFPVMGSLPARTLATPPHIAYNLVQPLFCALFVSILASLCASLCRPREDAGRAFSAAAWARGAWAMAIVALLGHMEPLRQMHQASQWLWPSGLDWWKTSRVITNTINEYPAFTLTIGDIHAHFYALALAALLFSLAWALFSTPLAQALPAAPSRSRAQVLARKPAVSARAEETLAAPEETTAKLKARTRPSHSKRSRKRRGAKVVSASARTSTATLEAPEDEVVEEVDQEAPSEAPRAQAAVEVPVERAPLNGPRLEHLLRWARVLSLGALLGAFILGNTWDVPLYALLSAACLYLSAAPAIQKPRSRMLGFAQQMGAVLGLALVLALPYLARFRPQVQGVQRELWLPPLSEWALLWSGIVALALLSIVGSKRVESDRRTLWQVLVGCGVIALVAPSFFYIRGAFGDGDYRHQDTVFKFGLQAWLLLGTAGACGVWWLLDEKRKPMRRLGFGAWAALWFVPALCTLGVVWMRTVGMKNPLAPTLDGALSMPIEDARAVAWLNANAPQGSVVLEAVKPASKEPNEGYYGYNEYGRIASLSGVPTPVGWTQHDTYWGADMGRDILPRLQAVRAVWNAPDAASARANLRPLGVTYIFIGDLERRTYTPRAIEMLKTLGNLVFTDGATVIVQLAPGK